MLLLSIPQPCYENWDKMSPREQGAFCGICSKIVVDFTTLTDEQVKNYFLENRGKETCGRFRNHQLTSEADYLTKLLSDNIPLWKKFLAVVVVVFGSLLSGCKENVKGKIDPTENDKIITGGILTEFHPSTEIKRDSSVHISEPITSTITKGNLMPVFIDDECTMGIGIIDKMPNPDTIMFKPVKPDSVKKTPVKKECDEPPIDSLIYLEPK